MSLIRCPECKKKISEYASHCIHCGYNLNEEEDKHVTVEMTNKKFKLQGLLSSILIIVGAIMLCNESNRTLASWLIIIGLFWNSINVIRKWWHHD